MYFESFKLKFHVKVTRDGACHLMAHKFLKNEQTSRNSFADIPDIL